MGVPCVSLTHKQKLSNATFQHNCKCRKTVRNFELIITSVETRGLAEEIGLHKGGTEERENYNNAGGNETVVIARAVSSSEISIEIQSFRYHQYKQQTI